MIQSVEAIVDPDGKVNLLEPVRVTEPTRAIVTLIYDAPSIVWETALLAEPALSEDWNRPEEEVAWAHLQSDQ